MSLPVHKYGYLTLNLSADSSFEFNLAVLKDLKLERSILGVDGQLTLVKAVYRSTKYGHFQGRDSEIVLQSRNDSIFVRPSSDSSSLTLRFNDTHGRLWLCTLIPQD